MIRLIVIAGPTAVGKTEYSIRLAQDLGGEIISADSMQIYEHMDIGSAKPSAEELAAVRHHLIGEIDPRRSFSAADYSALARERIAEVSSRGRLPILCGGTGLYINSVIYDMDFSSPEGDEEYRRELLERCGSAEALHARLAALDPGAAAQIHPNNVKRVLRAVERLEKGEGRLRPFSESFRPSASYEPVLIGLTRDREELYSRCDRRVELMLEAGLEDEVRGLLDMGLSGDEISMKGIGYKEVIACLREGRPASDAAEQIKLNTRHLAKRQYTWLRRIEGMRWFTLRGSGFDEDTYGEIRRYASAEDPEQDR